MLHSENARSPGLNALDCGSETDMVKALRDLSTAGRKGEEGHVRFHLGIWDDSHRIAVDAFRHRDGGFTLVAVDSMKKSQMIDQDLEKLSRTNPDLIKGAMVLPTPNLVHFEGCRIFAIHHLNALHDYQPHIQSLHRELHDKARGRAASRFSGSNWTHLGENIHTLNDAKEAFGLLPGKFFKHMQVKKPKTADKRTSLDQAEDWNPALRDQPVNKKGQTLRARLESQNPQKPLEEFSHAERTLSLDRKRLVLIDRAIAHYEKLAAK
ncbi:MAG TPA: YopJ family acetyltransferase [Fibrobacteria bacterium]|nr:YopJ family acetyltransferase [Fibrobacteria bacterium]